MKRSLRSRIAACAGALLLSSTLAACGGASASDDAAASDPSGTGPEDSKIVVSSVPSSLGLPLLVAKHGGFFEKNGLNVELRNLDSGPSIQALKSGDIDIYAGGAVAITARVEGLDLKMFALNVEHSGLKLIGKKELNGMNDLKGKVVASTGAGSVGEIFFRKAAEDAGITVGETGDVKFLVTQGGDIAVAQLSSGNVDAIIASSPASDEAIAKGFKTVIDFDDAGMRSPGPGQVALTSYLEKNPRTIQLYLKAYLEGIKHALDDPEDAKRIFREQTQASAQAAEDAYNNGKKAWAKDLTVPEEAIQAVLKYNPDLSDKAKNMNVADFYDNSHIAKANKSVGEKLFPDTRFASGK